MKRLALLVGVVLGSCVTAGGLGVPGPTEIAAVAEYPFLGRGIGVSGPFALLASRSPFPALVDGAVTPLTLVDDEWVRGEAMAPPPTEATVFAQTALLTPSGACVFGQFGSTFRMWVMRRTADGLEFDTYIDPQGVTGYVKHAATDDLSRIVFGDSSFSNFSGRVQIYERGEDGYSLAQTLFGSVILGGSHRFGGNVALHGDRLYVTSRQFRVDPGSGQSTFGAVHIFERTPDEWALVDTVYPTPPLTSTAGFGSALHVDDDMMVVSARTDSSQSTNQGSAWIFEPIGGSWVCTQRVRPFDGVAQDGFGAHIGRSDDQLLIVADNTALEGPRSGAIYRYRKIGDVWTPCERFASPYSPDRDEFGFAFGASDEAIVVSAPLVLPAPNGRVLAFKAELAPETPSAFPLVAPADGAVDLATTPSLLWNDSLEVGGYRVEVAADSAFGVIAFSAEVGASATSLVAPPGVLEDGRRYFWRVVALNDIGETLNADGPRTFRTSLLGDLNSSCSVTFEDLNGVLATFGQSGANVFGDANGDGITDFTDLNLVLSRFGRECDE